MCCPEAQTAEHGASKAKIMGLIHRLWFRIQGDQELITFILTHGIPAVVVTCTT